jgi:uncharacterized protein YkwD
MPISMPIRAGVVAAVTVLAVLFSLAFATLLPQRADAACANSGNWRSLSKAQSALLCLVNEERARHGLAPLRANRRLNGVARRHAGDLVRFRFVGHNSPARGSLMTRIRRSGWARGRSKWTFGEIMGDGLNRGASPTRIVRAWMRRPIHSRAILHPRFTSMGVGAVMGRPRGGRSKRGARTFVMTFAG